MRSSSLALALDLDGTLIPFAATPRAALLDEHARGVLLELVTAPGTTVAIVSGRPRDELAELTRDVPGLWLAAEHGAWTRDGRGWSPLGLEGAEPTGIEDALSRIAAAHPGALVERKTWSVCMHLRRVAAFEREALVVEASDAMSAWVDLHPEYEMLEGAMALEVRHRSAHKGKAIAWLRERCGDDVPMIALGDDVTDEDAFDALGPHDVAIATGPARPTRAEIRLATVDDVRRFLVWVARVRTRRADTRELVASGAVPRSRRAPAPATSLVVVSNRLPNDDGAPTRTRNVGGLVSGVSAALANAPGLWVGWSGQLHDGRTRVAIDADASPPRAAFDLRSDLHGLYYDGYSNQSLWPAFHGFLTRTRFRQAEWEAYVEVNDVFAEQVASVAGAGARIWAHDYHLLLLARALRSRGARQRIGHFLHIPFPPLESFETIPQAGELMDAMLAYDLLGFHTSSYAENFVRAATRFSGARPCAGGLELGSREVRVGVFPLGIDAAAFASPAEDEGAAEVSALADSNGRKLVLGVDRLDYTKGIVERLEAFARMLELAPEWRGRVTFLQVAVPSRADIPEYAEQRRAIETAVGRINGEHGEASWTPIRYVYRSYGRASLSRLYRAADVAMVTPLRDGMNLVAKEFVAAQDPSSPGVLVLSRFAGAADELRDAVLTNPYDRRGMALDLARALAMPSGERLARHRELARAVARSSPGEWAASFLSALDAAG